MKIICNLTRNIHQRTTKILVKNHSFNTTFFTYVVLFPIFFFNHNRKTLHGVGAVISYIEMKIHSIGTDLGTRYSSFHPVQWPWWVAREDKNKTSSQSFNLALNTVLTLVVSHKTKIFHIFAWLLGENEGLLISLYSCCNLRLSTLIINDDRYWESICILF